MRGLLWRGGIENRELGTWEKKTESCKGSSREKKKAEREKQESGAFIFGRRDRENKLKKASRESKEEEVSFSSMVEVSYLLHLHEDEEDHDHAPEHIQHPRFFSLLGSLWLRQLQTPSLFRKIKFLINK